MTPRLRDMIERVVWTAFQAFAGVLVATNITGDTDWKAVFYAAGIVAGIAAAKAVVAWQVGNPQSAALPETHPLPNRPPPA